MSVGVVLTAEDGQVTSLTKTKYCGEKGKSNLALFLLQGKEKNEKIKQKDCFSLSCCADYLIGISFGGFCRKPQLGKSNK